MQIKIFVRNYEIKIFRLPLYDVLSASFNCFEYFSLDKDHSLVLLLPARIITFTMLLLCYAALCEQLSFFYLLKAYNSYIKFPGNFKNIILFAFTFCPIPILKEKGKQNREEKCCNTCNCNIKFFIGFHRLLWKNWLFWNSNRRKRDERRLHITRRYIRIISLGDINLPV